MIGKAGFLTPELYFIHPTKLLAGLVKQVYTVSMKFRKYRKVVAWTIMVLFALTVLFGDGVATFFDALGTYLSYNPAPQNVAERYQQPGSDNIHLR